MRRCAKFVLAALCIASVARAQPTVADPDRAEIKRVIGAQIEAFRHDDGNAAFGFAAPAIQLKFGDAPHFLSAVRQAYPAVYRPRSFNFGTATLEDGIVVQPMEVEGPDGALGLALYDMEHETDGSWRIAGCRMRQSALRQT